MEVLTQDRAKPALPFAGVFRLIDFPLSNLRNSGIDDVWVLVQYETQSIMDALGGGRPWDLDRSRGGLRVVPPQQESDGSGDWHEGNAHALYAHRNLIAEAAPDALLVLSADHVYRLDYAEVVAEHLRREAECTVVTTEVSAADASHHAVVIMDEDTRIERVDYKPDDPETTTVATEVFVYDPVALVEVLEELHRKQSSDSAAGSGDEDNEPEDGSALGDFGEHLLPAMIERGRVYGYRLPGYWRDLGRPETYLAAHRELLTGDGASFDVDWPLSTTVERRYPARLHRGCSVADSMISDGCQIFGSVTRSVIGPGVTVEAGAQVRDSVLFADVVVGSGATIDWSIVADGCQIGSGAQVGESSAEDIDPERITLVGTESRVHPHVEVSAGARLEPGTVAG